MLGGINYNQNTRIVAFQCGYFILHFQSVENILHGLEWWAVERIPGSCPQPVRLCWLTIGSEGGMAATPKESILNLSGWPPN